MKYPIGPAYRMLLLTGLRLNECAQLSWPEVQGDTIIIPAARMKGKDGKAREHLVPLSSAATGGHRVAAALSGAGRSCSRSTRASDRLRWPARSSAISTGACCGRSRRWPAVAARIITPSRCRTGPTTTCAASSAPVCRHCASRTTSRKRCLHTSHPASSAPTTLHEYQDEKREALEAWAQHLATIVNPTAAPAKVVKLREAAAMITRCSPTPMSSGTRSGPSCARRLAAMPTRSCHGARHRGCGECS